MTKRSYEKTKALPKQKDFIPTNGCGTYFDDHIKNNRSIAALGRYGDSLIRKFIEENQRREKILKEKEKDLWEYKHSKPKVFYNTWKPTNNRMGEFMSYPIDKIHSFKQPQKKRFLIKEPFRIPKKDGDYFYDRKSTAKVHY
jgi:hypothetical protein